MGISGLSGALDGTDMFVTMSASAEPEGAFLVPVDRPQTSIPEAVGVIPVGDVDGDGLPDLITTDPTTGTVAVLQQQPLPGRDANATGWDRGDELDPHGLINQVEVPVPGNDPGSEDPDDGGISIVIIVVIAVAATLIVGGGTAFAWYAGVCRRSRKGDNTPDKPEVAAAVVVASGKGGDGKVVEAEEV